MVHSHWLRCKTAGNNTTTRNEAVAVPSKKNGKVGLYEDVFEERKMEALHPSQLLLVQGAYPGKGLNTTKIMPNCNHNYAKKDLAAAIQSNFSGNRGK